MAHYLGLDVSTQSMTGIIIDSDSCRIIIEESINYDQYFSKKYRVHHGVVEKGIGVVHSYPLMWVEALDLLFTKIRDNGFDFSSIRALSGCGQQHGTVYLNKDAPDALKNLLPEKTLDSQLNGIFSRETSPVWMDSSTSLQCEEIEHALGGTQKVLELTGNNVFERFSAPQIRKFSQQEPKAYEATARIALVSSFIASVLVGKAVPVDAGDGSGTNLMDIQKRQWNKAAMEATAPDLSRRMDPVAESGAIAGTVHAYFVKKYGFREDCLVLPFSGDNPSSLIGLGLVEPGNIGLSLGTSDTLFACMSEPRFSQKEEGCVFASPDGTNFMALICFMNGSLARESVRDSYGLSWEMFGRILNKTKAGNEGRLILPYFDSEIVPNVPAGVRRKSLAPEDAAGNVRAVIEAQAMSSYIHSRWMGIDATDLYVTGGGSVNQEILQIFADVYGCPLNRSVTTNSAALGSAFVALKGHQPNMAWQEIVRPFQSSFNVATIFPRDETRATYNELIGAYSELESASI